MLSKKKPLYISLIISFCLLILYFLIFLNRNIYVTSNAPNDSTLQVTQAMSISSRNWLGSYNDLTLAKGLSYPFLLVTMHLFNIPINYGMVIFNLFAVCFFLAVTKQFIKTYFYIPIFLFLFLFNPLLFTNSQGVPYRDSTAYGAMIFLLAWIIGLVLNVTIKYHKFSFVSSILSGCFGLPYWNNLREDSSWIYLFIIIAALCIGIAIVINKKYNLIYIIFASLAIPIIFLVSFNVFIAYKNYQSYNRFIVNEYTSRDFKQVVGTLTTVKGKNWVINVPVNGNARKQLYKTVPAFRRLRPYLDGNRPDGMQGFKNFGINEPSLGHDYQGGWFPWAFRGAMVRANKIKNSKQFEYYNYELVSQIIKADKTGRLNGVKKPRTSLVPPINSKIILPSLIATLKVAKTFFTYNGENKENKFDIQKPNLSIETDKNLQKEEASYLGIQSKTKRIITFYINCIQMLKLIYSLVQIFILVFIFYKLIRYVIIKRERLFLLNFNNTQCNWLFLTVFGLILSLLLRLMMLGYVTATSFIAYDAAYLSSAYSLLVVLFSVFWIFEVNLKNGKNK